MSLPPEHINIKRRREEEPVETLYIQSELHQKKRRFTDFIFQRVDASLGVGGGSAASTSTTSSAAAAAVGDVNHQRRDVQSPRAVSGFAGTSSTSSLTGSAWPPRGGIGSGGAPRVRVTSPGAEGRERGRGSGVVLEGGSGVIGARAGAGLRTSSSRVSLRSRSRGPSPLRRKGSASQLMAAATNLRRFHLSKPTIAASFSSSGAGVQKKRGDAGRAILVEKLASGQLEKGFGFSDASASLKNGGMKDVSMVVDEGSQGISTAPPRKRPIINSAEKRWKEEQRSASSRSKANLIHEHEKGKGKTGKSVRDDPSNWDHDSDQLAQELEEVALEMMREEAKPPTPQIETPGYTPIIGAPKPELKYQPRNPKRRVHGEAQKREDPDAMETDAPATMHATSKDVTGEEEDSDGDYVYDTYVRRPLPVQEPSSERDAAAAAAASAETILQATKIPIPIDGDQLSRNIGIVVISAEDEEYWDTYAVDDDSRGEEREWDSEDEDSNAEDHPSTDYPDEDLASGDEDDDPTAIYRNFRYRAASDDEQDFSDFEDEDDFGYHVDDADSDGEVGGGGRGMGMGWGFR